MLWTILLCSAGRRYLVVRFLCLIQHTPSLGFGLRLAQRRFCDLCVCVGITSCPGTHYPRWARRVGHALGGSFCLSYYESVPRGTLVATAYTRCRIAKQKDNR
ncbi:hypothetical protein BD779DRAFT_1542914 [Infundibulicybe gibba]|nr:hypothetical protein BD779DRAFT_1542914 [Infundibulicybe gibba]